MSSKLQTKDWLSSQKWYENGEQNECEKYQKNIINLPLLKTNICINMPSKTLEEVKCPMIESNGFEYTKHFDGVLELQNKKILFNLTFVCDNGDNDDNTQIEMLRESYAFIKYQIKIMEKYLDSDYLFEGKQLYFINILDGDYCYKHKDKFDYLFENVKDNIRDRVLMIDSKYYSDNIRREHVE